MVGNIPPEIHHTSWKNSYLQVPAGAIWFLIISLFQPNRDVLVGYSTQYVALESDDAEHPALDLDLIEVDLLCIGNSNLAYL